MNFNPYILLVLLSVILAAISQIFSKKGRSTAAHLYLAGIPESLGYRWVCSADCYYLAQRTCLQRGRGVEERRRAGNAGFCAGDTAEQSCLWRKDHQPEADRQRIDRGGNRDILLVNNRRS